MKIIDARSGREVKIGDTVDWGDGEGFTLLDADVGLFSGEACIRMTTRDDSQAEFAPVDPTDRLQALRIVKRGPLITRTAWIPLGVRWLHPAFRFQHVAFIPS